MIYTITLIPGDGIGPEVSAAMRKVVDATGVLISWESVSLPGNHGELDVHAVRSIVRNRVAIKGPTGTPLGTGHRSYNVQLRETFDLYANVRPVRTIPGVATFFESVPIDLVVFRENLEDLYIGEESLLDDGKEAVAVSRITDHNTRRIAEYARDYMLQHGRKKITIGAKSNILKLTHGLFQRVSEEMLANQKEFSCEHAIPDALAVRLIQHPDWFDCILLPNFLGDIFSDLCAGFVGGLGVAPGANIGENYAVFEAVHGTAPDIAGQGIANPTALILSAAMMLDHIGEATAAGHINAAIDAVYADGVSLTGDIKKDKPVGTMDFADAVIAQL